MDSKLVKELMDKKLRPSELEFFTRREDAVVSKERDGPAKVEYICPFCEFYEIKEITMEKDSKGKRYKRPKFKCSKCGKTILIDSLKKK